MERGRIRLRELVAERGFSLAHLSRHLSRNHAYLGQYIGRAMPYELDLEDRVELAKFLQCTVEEISVDKQKVRAITAAQLSLPITPIDLYAPRGGLPVMGKVDGLTLKFDGKDVGTTMMPDMLIGVPQAYACQMPDETMQPVFARGVMLYVNPTRRPKVGDEVVCRLKDSTACIRKLISFKRSTVTLQQFNPEKKTIVPRATIESLHQIVMSTRMPINAKKK